MRLPRLHRRAASNAMLALPFTLTIVVLLTLTGCVVSGPSGPGAVAADARYGLASCRASARRGCPELSGRTLYTGQGTALYFAPDGFLYSWAERDLQRRRWGVAPDGQSVSFTGGALADFAFPISELQGYQAFEGDAAQLQTRYQRGVRAMPFALTPRSARNFRTVLNRLYA